MARRAMPQSTRPPERRSTRRDPPPLPRLAVSLRDAGFELGVSVDTLRPAIASGELRVARMRGRVLVPTRELARYLAARTEDPR